MSGWSQLQAPIDYSSLVASSRDALPPRQDIKEEIPTSDLGTVLKIRQDSLNIIVGNPNSGKTNLLRNIVYHNARDYNAVLLCNPFMSSSNVTDKNDYSWCSPRWKVHNEDDIIDRIEQFKAFLQQHPTAHGLIILDDCKVFFNDKKNKKFFEEMGAVNRKFRLSVLVVLQSLQHSPTGFRQCIDSIFVTEGRGKTLPLVREITGLKELESLYEEHMDGPHNHRNVLRLNIPANMAKWQLVRPPKAPLFALRCSI